jgi:NAD(P)-dependent dehydrogenase (short-subunit alcohol dehydrogenase family)
MERRSFFNDRVHTGIIGAGGRGRYLIGQFKELGVNVAAVSVSEAELRRPSQKASRVVRGRAIYPLADVSRSHSRRKLTSICACTVTGLPSLTPGLNLHFLTASIAFSSSPKPRLWRTRMLMALPEGSTST